MTAFPTAQCKGCGRPIVWARLDGKAIPLDPRPPIYRVQPDGKNPPAATRLHAHESADKSDPGYPIEFMVSHFATCPKAADFSGSKRTSKEARADGAPGRTS